MNYNILKIKHCGLIAIVAVLLLSFTACKDENADYINLSINSFTFSPLGEEELIVDVKSGQAWTVECEGKWVIEKSKDGNSITLGASATQSGLDRTAKVIFRSGDAEEVLVISQLGTKVNYVSLLADSQASVMSPNGEYVGGVSARMKNDSYEFTPFIINVKTGQRTDKPVQKVECTASSITDEGLLFIKDNNMVCKYFDSDNNLVDIKIPAGMRNPSISATSFDGKIWVGYVQKTADRIYYPIKWVEGQPELLEVPEKTLLGQPLDVGAYARGCSADGSIIYGAIADDQTAIYWKADGTVDFVGKDKIRKHTITINHTGSDVSFEVVDRPIFYADNTSMSPDGKYLATTFAQTVAPNKYEKVIYYPAYFDLEKEKLIYITDLPAGFEDGFCSTISNDGILSFGCPAIGYTDAYVYDIHSGTTTSAPDYIKDEYGVIVSNSARITRITNDGNTLFGMSILLLGVSYQYWYIDIAE